MNNNNRNNQFFGQQNNHQQRQHMWERCIDTSSMGFFLGLAEVIRGFSQGNLSEVEAEMESIISTAALFYVIRIGVLEADVESHDFEYLAFIGGVILGAITANFIITLLPNDHHPFYPT